MTGEFVCDLQACLNIWKMSAWVLHPFCFCRTVEHKICLLHYFMCWVTWSTFVILQACRLCISSFSPRNILCDSFFVWRFVLKGFISGFGFITLLIKSSSVMVRDVSLYIGWFFNIYPTQFTFRVWGVKFCTDQNYFMMCLCFEHKILWSLLGLKHPQQI